MLILADALPNHILHRLQMYSYFNKEVQSVWIHSYTFYLYPVMLTFFYNSSSRTGGLKPQLIIFLSLHLPISPLWESKQFYKLNFPRSIFQSGTEWNSYFYSRMFLNLMCSCILLHCKTK